MSGPSYDFFYDLQRHPYPLIYCKYSLFGSEKADAQSRPLRRDDRGQYLVV
jgi:hypothetical protein